jgi:hypothetical protein
LLSLHRTIREIDAEDWNQLTEQNAFATHGWLLTVETCCRASIQPLYFSLRQGAALVAASVCYIIGPTGEMETLDDMLLGRLRRPARRIGLGFLPAIVCGPVMGYGWHIGVSPELNSADAHKARQQLLDAIEAEARTLRLQAAFVHILDEEAELKKLLDQRRYLPLAAAALDLLRTDRLHMLWNSTLLYQFHWGFAKPPTPTQQTRSRARQSLCANSSQRKPRGGVGILWSTGRLGNHRGAFLRLSNST